MNPRRQYTKVAIDCSFKADSSAYFAVNRCINKEMSPGVYNYTLFIFNLGYSAHLTSTFVKICQYRVPYLVDDSLHVNDVYDSVICDTSYLPH